MKQKNFFDFVRVDEHAATPKYVQLTHAILGAVERGLLKNGEMLPSINELSLVMEISRDTAEKGYKLLKSLGVIGSFPGKGYYILSTDYKQKIKICLFFNKLSAHKKIVYDSFVETLGHDIVVTFYVYNNDFLLFKKLLSEKTTNTHT